MKAKRLIERFFLFAILTVLTLSTGCKANAKERIDLLKQSQYWLNWEGEQTNYATPANIWRGFDANEDFLTPRTLNPTIAFNLKKTAAREFVHIVYNCADLRTIQVFVNDQLAAILPASPKFSRYSFSCTELRSGFNQIRFVLPSKKFRLRALYLQKKGTRFADRNIRKLVEGERFEIYLLPGHIEFEFQGQASLKAHSFKIVADRDLSAPFSQILPVSEKKTVYSYSSATPFVASISCLKGKANILNLWYSAEKTEKKEPIVAETTAHIDKNKIKDIFIFLIDACQAGHLGLYGYSRGTAPRISEFAKDSLVFKQAFTNASYTPGSVGTIFTGLYPNHHQILGILDILDKNILTLPQFLKRTGYSTSVFTANAHISNRSGFVRGVDYYKQFLQEYRFGQSYKMVEAFTDWVRASPIPSFAYLHFMEPHFPIVPPPPFLNQYKKIIHQKKDLVIRHITRDGRFYSPEEVQDVIDDYDSTINYVDSLFGQTIDYLKKINRYDGSLIILVSDHGEGCYEHGAWGHGYDVYPEITRVPLVIKFPAACGLKGEIGSPTQLGAIFPTIYKILTGQDGPFDIKSLTPILNNRQYKVGGMVVTQGFKDEQIYAIAWNGWYYINSLKRNWEDLFKLGDKPSRSQIQAQPDLTSFLRLRFLGWLRLIQTKTTEAARADLRSLSQKELEHFKSLGYL
ncbi:MAG: sulfatase [Candidatus Aminicenantes bacterium]|nr:sulfatase [Candidatus Aminicenantes bacterium]